MKKVLVLLLVAVMLTGCGSTGITQEEYDKPTLKNEELESKNNTEIQTEENKSEDSEMEKVILTDKMEFIYDEENKISVSFYIKEKSLKKQISVNINFLSGFEKESFAFWSTSCSMLYNISDEVFITTNLGENYYFTSFINGEIENNTLISKFSESDIEKMIEFKTQLDEFLAKNNLTIIKGYEEKIISEIINADYESNMIEFKESCREYEYDNLFFGDIDLEGRKVKINLMVLSLAQDKTDPTNPIKTLECGAERKTDSGMPTYVGGNFYLYDDRSEPNITEFNEGDKLTVCGIITNYNYNTWDGYNNFNVKAKIIEKTH